MPFLDIDGRRFSTASSYWGKPAKNNAQEIDVVAESQDGRYLLVGECKWTEKTPDLWRLLAELQEKAALLPFAKDKRIHPVLFLKNKPPNAPTENVFDADDVLLWTHYE